MNNEPQQPPDDPVQEEQRFELKFWHIIAGALIALILIYLPAAIAWWRAAHEK